MAEIIFEFMSEEYCAKYSEKYRDFMKVLKKFLIFEF